MPPDFGEKSVITTGLVGSKGRFSSLSSSLQAVKQSTTNGNTTAHNRINRVLQSLFFFIHQILVLLRSLYIYNIFNISVIKYWQ